MTEQELMIMHLLDCPRVELYTSEKKLSAEEVRRLDDMHLRRQQGEPLQYILGDCEFWGLKFLVDKRVLIPRLETELLVDVILKKVSTLSTRPLRILDIGTGSGNIAISLARLIEESILTATDVSDEALEVARTNAKINSVEDKVTFLKSDLFNFLPKPGANTNLFDIIVSNPPYIPTDRIDQLPNDVRQEPRLALDGGKDGLEFYRRIVSESPAFLKKGGWLFFEIGDDQRPAVEKILKDSCQFKNITCQTDLTQRDRIILAERT